MSIEIPEGSEVKVEKNSALYEGRAMPSPEGVLIIKLGNGYNVGLKLDPNLKILEIKERARKKPIKRLVVEKMGGKTIAILGTGGTIASYVDYTTGAVHPTRSTGELLNYIPEIRDVANVRAKILFSVLSEDLGPKHWKILAKEVKKEFEEGCRGVVISHGTDTMSFTAAGLAFMLRELSGPVILTGAQRSADRPSSDGFLNLLYSTRAALTDLGEVVVAMHDTLSDDRITLHRACRVRKMHTSARGAFKSIDADPIGYVNSDRVYLREHDKKGDNTIIDTRMDEKVGILYSYPGLDYDVFEAFSERHNGIVIAGTGLGHCPDAILPGIKMAIDKGKAVVMTSQCIHGKVNLAVYSRGRELLKAGIIACDLLPEVAMIKLGWVLGHTKDQEKIGEMMRKEYTHEFGGRRFIDG